MLNLNSIMIGTTQPAVLAAFYEQVIGKPADMAESDQGFYGWEVGSAYLSVMAHSEMAGSSNDPARIMFNFETRQVQEGLNARRPETLQRTHELYYTARMSLQGTPR